MPAGLTSPFPPCCHAAGLRMCVYSPVAIGTEQGGLEGMLVMAAPEGCRAKRIKDVPVDCAAMTPLRSCRFHTVVIGERSRGKQSGPFSVLSFVTQPNLPHCLLSLSLCLALLGGHQETPGKCHPGIKPSLWIQALP